MTPPGHPPAGIIRAGQDDIEVLSHVIADAFFPLAPSQWLIPDPGARRQIFPAYFRMHAEHALADGIVHATPARDAAALWLPLGPQFPDPPAGYGERLAAITGPWARRFAAFDAALAARHLTGTSHHHLAVLAVRPGRQGQGTGTALLAAHHALLDREGVTAYLEASGPGTRRLYLRHGYADHAAPIELHDGLLAGDRPPGPPAASVRMFPMIRHPGPAA